MSERRARGRVCLFLFLVCGRSAGGDVIGLWSGSRQAYLVCFYHY